MSGATERKHYPPLVTFHAAHCPAISDDDQAIPVDVAREKFPNHHFDVCAAVDIVPYVIAESATAPHRYEPSGIQPEDAIAELCRRCFGTHGPEREGREVISVKSEPTNPSHALKPPPGLHADGQV